MFGLKYGLKGVGLARLLVYFTFLLHGVISMDKKSRAL